MEEYRDIRFSVPGWWFCISFVLWLLTTDHFFHYLNKDEFLSVLLPMVALFITGPSVSFFLSSIYFLVVSKLPKFWGASNRDEQFNKWVRNSLKDYPDYLRETINRRWSYVHVSYGTLLGIFLGSITGLIYIKAFTNWSMVAGKVMFVVILLICVVVIVLCNAEVARKQLIKLDMLYWEKYHPNKDQTEL